MKEETCGRTEEVPVVGEGRGMGDECSRGRRTGSGFRSLCRGVFPGDGRLRELT